MIKLLGVELEGGWNIEPLNICYDGSVHVDAPYVGEIQSPAMELDELLEWVDKRYPDYSNHTCGLHVHFSMDNEDYACLMKESFYKYFRKEIQKFIDNFQFPNSVDKETLINRFNGNNRFCRDTFIPEDQYWLEGKTNARYCQLNFCYAIHGTLECRLAPMFQDKETAKQYIKTLYTVIADYLSIAPRWSGVVEDIEDDEIYVYKKEDICV